MAELQVINQVDKDLFYIIDFVVGVSGDDLPEYWTADRVGDGYYKAQYQGATIHKETGEATGGHWVETGGPSHEDYVAQAEYERLLFLEEASSRIVDLQDLSDTGEATERQSESLLSWKKYRVQLKRIDTEDAPNITWPVKPE